jgi:hypothetical protein
MLKFQIDKNYLIAYAFRHRDKDLRISEILPSSIENFRNALKIQDPEMLNLLSKLWVDSLLNPAFDTTNVIPKITEFLKEIALLPEFQAIYKETEDSLVLIQKEWESNFQKSFEMIKDMTNINFENDNYQIFVTHPAIRNFRYVGNNKIACSYQGDYPNFNTISLWHHILLSKIFGPTINQSILDLMCENELRIRLNGGEYPPLFGNEPMRKLTEMLLPDWKEYLKRDKRDLEAFVEEMCEKYGRDEKE